ncbi:peptidase [Massilia sp. PWRC2]|uniref:peptidase n=1 Tax=Massilia sp. PWRC2 TaxID=2804626 RepID=UPI003CE9EFE1
MTYCTGIRLDAGLVFLSDSRTNAGVDQVGTFRKMTVYEHPGERVMVLMTSGNLSISQAVREQVSAYVAADGTTIWNAPSMLAATRIIGEAVRFIHQRDAQALAEFRIDFNISIIFGGQIRGERCRLFNIYSAGNFIESHDQTTYFQIGEAKYGKPILDRVINPQTGLDEAAKCALVSMDSTLRSNISVGLPLDLLVYQADSLAVTRFTTIDERNQYFQMLRSSWGQQLKAVFESIDDPVWDAAPGTTDNVLCAASGKVPPLRVPLPAYLSESNAPAAPLQSLAQDMGGQQS